MMGETVTQAQFFEAMQKLDDKMQDYHRRQRDHIDDAVQEVTRVIAQHDTHLQEVSKKVLVIETQRDLERSAAAKHGMIAGTVMAGATVGLIESVKRYLFSK